MDSVLESLNQSTRSVLSPSIEGLKGHGSPTFSPKVVQTEVTEDNWESDKKSIFYQKYIRSEVA